MVSLWLWLWLWLCMCMTVIIAVCATVTVTVAHPPLTPPLTLLYSLSHPPPHPTTDIPLKPAAPAAPQLTRVAVSASALTAAGGREREESREEDGFLLVQVRHKESDDRE
jgi:hypothetical protein